MSRFCFCNCPAGFSADPERHAPDCPGRSGAGKSRTPVPATLTASQPVDSGVDFGIGGRSVRVSQEAYSIFLAREAAGREKIAALQQRLTAADERVDHLNSVVHLSEADSAALQKRVHALTETLNQIYGWCGAFLDDDIDMPKASVKALRDITAKALPIHGTLLETP